MFITSSDDSFPVTMFGFVMSMVGVILFSSNIIQPSANESIVMKNMVSNVKEKYDADLHVEASQVKGLNEYKTYTLTFEDGAKGEYKIKFESTGEPVIADEPLPPSAEELNSEAKTSDKPSPTTAPTSAELEESAKK